MSCIGAWPWQTLATTTTKGAAHRQRGRGGAGRSETPAGTRSTACHRRSSRTPCRGSRAQAPVTRPSTSRLRGHQLLPPPLLGGARRLGRRRHRLQHCCCPCRRRRRDPCRKPTWRGAPPTTSPSAPGQWRRWSAAALKASYLVAARRAGLRS